VLVSELVLVSGLAADPTGWDAIVLVVDVDCDKELIVVDMGLKIEVGVATDVEIIVTIVRLDAGCAESEAIFMLAD